MNKRPFNLLLIVATFLVVSFACSRADGLEKTDDIDTNRPSFMDSPLVLPRASVQAENGTLFQWFRGRQYRYDIPETEVRVGLSSRTELQMFIPTYNLVRSDSEISRLLRGNAAAPVFTSQTSSLVSDLSEIGIKEQLGPILPDAKNVPGFLRNYNLAMILAVTPPTGSPVISNAGTIGTLRFPWSKSIGKNYSIAGMQSLLFNGRTTVYQPDVLFGRNIGSRGFVFAEYGGFLTEEHGIVNIAHFGGVRKLTRHQQVDMQFGFGMNHTSPIAFVGVGYSFRFDKFKW